MTPPTPAANSYGTASGVANHARIYTLNGSFMDAQSITVTTISFDNSHHILDSGNGLAVFNVGIKINISGTSLNNGLFVVTQSSSGQLTVTGNTATEVAGSSVTITSDATNPSLTAIVAWIDQLSATMNAALAGYGFMIPISQADAKNLLIAVIEELAGDLAAAVNGAGRFFTDQALKSGITPWSAVRQDIYDFAKQFAGGLDALKAARNTIANEYQIGFKATNAQGVPAFPIFQREAFGNQFEDWENNPGSGGLPPDYLPDVNG